MNTCGSMYKQLVVLYDWTNENIGHAYNRPDSMIRINIEVMHWYYGLTIDWRNDK